MKSMLICTNLRHNPSKPSCGRRGADKLKSALVDAIEEAGLPIQVEEIQCLGECGAGPNVRFVPRGPLLQGLNADEVDSVIEEATKFCQQG